MLNFSHQFDNLYKQYPIVKYPTLSSLAFAIYRSSFMPADVIPQLSGQIAKDIRLGYMRIYFWKKKYF